ncbi:MAG: arginine deiminase [Bacilli bacterium]|nr:arginine deiminase [Bacilli bacterium]
MSIHVFSEIGKLKTVLLHEPGEELHNLTPKYLDDLLFDDIPWLPLAKKEHQKFAQTFIDNGVKVVYLTDLVCEAIDTSKEVKEEFVSQFVKEANINSVTLSELVHQYLLSISSTKEMVLKMMAGIKKNELPNYQAKTLRDMVDEKHFATDPMPNLYFQRDPFASIGEGISLNNMFSITRSRETIFGEYIFKYHPVYKGTKLFYNRNLYKNIEGGDIMVLNKTTLIIGASQRTTTIAIETLAKNLFFKENTTFENIIVLSIPKARTFMHLDTIFTQVDKNKFTIHQQCYDLLTIFEIHKGENGKLSVENTNAKLKDVLEKYIKMPIILIPCGGEDHVSADREQWSDGSNTIAIAPGRVIAYERNDITNNILRSYGIEVFEIPSSELSRGRGGPRCMCMPLEREDVE